MDILAEVPPQDFQRVTVLYISKNTRTPDAPANEPQLRRRQRDAALAAWERAKTFYDAKHEEWQEILDQPQTDLRTCSQQTQQDLCRQHALCAPKSA